ncbi:MAG: dienelactone hydrolase family protein [Alphaproteobacteria bacterium]|nr:dienelactone hydrolase family protein [Alphaproteobacteria bacterium]
MKKLFCTLVVTLTFLLNFSANALETKSYIPENPTRALILIHGYSGSGETMVWIKERLEPLFPDTAFYFPTAPDKAPYAGYQWFVIPELGEGMSREDIYQEMMKDALRNTKHLHKLVKEIRQTQNIAYENIDIAGFSQGGLMALLSALTYEAPLGKVISLSGVPLVFTPDFTPSYVKNLPNILLIQGDKDNVIPKDSLDLTRQTLNALKISPVIQEIPNMSHTINAEALQEFQTFLK